MSSPFGVYSEVGRLRKVMASPGPGAAALTPANHDALFLRRCARGALLRRSTTPSSRSCAIGAWRFITWEKPWPKRWRPTRRCCYHRPHRHQMTAGVSLVDEVRACPGCRRCRPMELVDRLIGGADPGRDGHGPGRPARQSVPGLRRRFHVDDPFVLPPLPNTPSSRDLHPAGFTTAFRSTPTRVRACRLEAVNVAPSAGRTLLMTPSSSSGTSAGRRRYSRFNVEDFLAGFARRRRRRAHRQQDQC